MIEQLLIVRVLCAFQMHEFKQVVYDTVEVVLSFRLAWILGNEMDIMYDSSQNVSSLLYWLWHDIGLASASDENPIELRTLHNAQEVSKPELAASTLHDIGLVKMGSKTFICHLVEFSTTTTTTT